MDAEIEKIYELARQQAEAERLAAEAEEEDYYYEDSNDYDDSDDDYSDSYDDDYYEDTSSSFSGSMTWPVPGHYVISSYYGSRWGTWHNGIDISDGATNGATIVAAASGTVTDVVTGCPHDYGKSSSCGCGGGYGNYVVISHGNGTSTYYAHCSSIYVSYGQSVSAGEAIGSVGSTGYSTGPHLHFEVLEGGSPVDPTNYLY